MMDRKESSQNLTIITKYNIYRRSNGQEDLGTVDSEIDLVCLYVPSFSEGLMKTFCFMYDQTGFISGK